MSMRWSSRPHAVAHDLEPLARHVDRRAVGEMAAGGEIEPHEGVAGLHQRHEHGLVGLAAGVRLHIGEAAVEQAAGALDRELLGDVDELAAAVIAPARIAFGVLVGHHRALRLEHGARHDVLRGDQLDLVALAAELERDGARDLGIGLGQARREEAVRQLHLRRFGRAHGCLGPWLRRKRRIGATAASARSWGARPERARV